MKRARVHLRSFFSVVFAAAIVACFVACGGGDDVEVPTKTPSKAPEKQAANQAAKPAPTPRPAPSKPPPPNASVGEQLKSEVQLPDYYPDDAPIYPGTKPAQVNIRNGRASAMFGTKDAPDVVTDYVFEFLGEQSWNPQSQRQDDRVLMQGVKEGRRITVLVSRTDEGKPSEITLIAVSVDEKK